MSKDPNRMFLTLLKFVHMNECSCISGKRSVVFPQLLIEVSGPYTRGLSEWSLVSGISVSSFTLFLTKNHLMSSLQEAFSGGIPVLI